MSRRNLLLAVLAVALIVSAVVIKSTGAGTYLIRARFVDVDGLKAASEVRLDGASVGTVRSLRLAPDDSVVATLAIKSSAGPVGSDARAEIRDANLLGEKFVDIAPGNRASPAPSGSLVPDSRTGVPVDLDQLLDVLDPTTRARLDILVNSSGMAFDGRGADFGALLRQLPPALDRTGALVSQFASDNAALGRLLDESGQLVAALTPQRQALGALIDSAEGAMSATASRQRQLASTVVQAPGTIAQLNTTLGQLDRTARPLRPAALALRSTAAPLTGVLRSLPVLDPSAVTTLKTARAVAPSLTRLGNGASPFVRRLEPTAAKLNTFAYALAPVSSTFDRGIVDVLRTLEGWARSIQVRDGASHIFRAELVFSPQLLTTLLDGFLAPSNASAHRHHNKPSVLGHPTRPQTHAMPPPSDSPLSDLQRRSGALVKQLLQALPKLPSPPTGSGAPQPGGQASPSGGDAQKLLSYLLGR
jgi:ABC-type transporter Mla subunit MlaD